MRILNQEVSQGDTAVALRACGIALTSALLTPTVIRDAGARPAFKGYRGFPGSICASPNSMVVHGIPGPYELKRGDVISIDVGVTKDGWVADGAMTLPVGPIDTEAKRLLAVTVAALLYRHASA